MKIASNSLSSEKIYPIAEVQFDFMTQVLDNEIDIMFYTEDDGIFVGGFTDIDFMGIGRAPGSTRRRSIYDTSSNHDNEHLMATISPLAFALLQDMVCCEMNFTGETQGASLSALVTKTLVIK